MYFAFLMIATSSCCGLAGGVKDVHRVAAPILELRLAPPEQPQPQVSAELAVLENARDKLEARLRSSLDIAYETALQDARLRIDALIKRSLGSCSLNMTQRSGFLMAAERFFNPGGFSIEADLFPVPAPDPQTQVRIDALEHKLSTLEQQTLQQAKDDLPRITDVVLNALATELHEFLHASSARRHASFLEMAHVASVRLGSSSAVFPTIRTLVEEMEHRRHNAESAEFAHALEIEARLLASELAYVKQAISNISTTQLSH